MKLSGYICARNAVDLDYCLELGARSLLRVVDELVLCDSDSTDGTRDLMLALAAEDGRVRVVNRPWEDPAGDAHWWVRWLNWAREQCSHEMQMTLDADEVLDDSEECAAAVRDAVARGGCVRADRLNYWKGLEWLIPEGHCCGKWVARIGPRRMYMPSDEGDPLNPELAVEAVRDGRVRIHHLGFIRRPEAFYRKARVVLRAFFNSYDERLERLEAEGRPLWECETGFSGGLVPCAGPWPEGVVRWVRERADGMEAK